MTAVSVDVKDTLMLAALKNGRKRQRYAIAGAINTTLRAIQASVPAHMRRQGFVVRNSKFLFGGSKYASGAANKITDKAKPVEGRQFGRIAVSTSSFSSGRRFLLAQFERGGQRKPMTPGAQSVAVPLLGRPARPSISQPVVPAYSFAALKFKKFSGGKELKAKRRGRKTASPGFFGEYGRTQIDRALGDSTVQWKGQLRTFILRNSKNAPHGGVFQRVGRGRSAIRMIYSFRQNVALDANLKFASNAAAVTERTFRQALLAEVHATLKFHAFTPRKAAS